MKRTSSFKTAVFISFIIAASAILGSCNNKNPEPQTKDSSDVASKENDAKFANKKQEMDAQFLVDAATLSLEEIKLGKLAQVKGTTAEVRDLGKMLAEAHTKTLKEVADLAQTRQITIPDSATNETMTSYNDLNGKAGNDFNKAYCDRMVSGHKSGIEKFEKESADSRDQDIKEWAAKTLPKLREHLQKVFDCQKKFEKV